MKIKLGFVTNSSSCAYCLWGVEISEEDITDEIKRLLWEEFYSEEKTPTWRKPKTYEEYVEKDDYLGDVLEYFEDKINVTTTDDGEIFGLEPDSMEDNEKLIEFKQRIVDRLNKLGFKFSADDVDFYNGIREC